MGDGREKGFGGGTDPGDPSPLFESDQVFSYQILGSEFWALRGQSFGVGS